MPKNIPDAIKVKYEKAATRAAKKVLFAMWEKAFEEKNLSVPFDTLEAAKKVHRQLANIRNKYQKSQLRDASAGEIFERWSQVRLYSPSKIKAGGWRVSMERMTPQISESTQAVLDVQNKIDLEL